MCKGPNENKVGGACVVQVAERIEHEVQLMKWRTIIEVATIQPNDATVTQAECTAAVEAARAIFCLARSGCICYDLDGNFFYGELGG